MELNKIHFGDSLELIRKLPDNSVDLVVTDPPYKVSQKYGGGVDADNLIAVSGIMQLMPEISRVLKPNRFCIVFYDNRILPLLFESVKYTNLVYRKQIFLYRRWGSAHRWVGWMQCTDPVCVFVNGFDEPFVPELKGTVKHDVWIKDKPEKENTGHPAQKPLEMIEHIISWCSNENEVVFDPYMGSGTTALAAQKQGRQFIGFERQKEFYDMATERIQSGFYVKKDETPNLFTDSHCL